MNHFFCFLAEHAMMSDDGDRKPTDLLVAVLVVAVNNWCKACNASSGSVPALLSGQQAGAVARAWYILACLFQK
jgi:hypothetical protein